MLVSDLPPLDLTECSAQLIWANERELECRHLHMHSSFEDVTVCWLIDQGTVTLTGQEGEVTAEPGDWVFPGNYLAEQRFSPRSRILSIRFTLISPGGEPLFARPKTRVLSAQSEPSLEQTGRALIRRLEPWSARESLVLGRNRIPLDENYLIEAAFYKWIAAYIQCQHRMGETIQSRTRGDNRIHQALTRLERYPFHEGFSEAGLARDCGLSVNQFIRLFKRETGDSPLQYYDRLRLERARHALTETGIQVKEIAYELGFSSSPHFTNWFKKREGAGPRAYRNRTIGRV